MKISLYLSLLLIFVVGACSSKKKEAELLELSKPEWLKNRPVSSEYFYGIGTTAKVGGAVYYQEQAKEKALSDMAKQINTKIKSEQSLYRMEDNSGVYEYMQSRIKATSDEFLEGYEYIDKWEDLNYYYTYYRLSKSHFYALKAKRKEKALTLSYGHYTEAINARQQGKFMLAIEEYAASIDAISGYLNEACNYTHQNSSIDLFVASRDGLSDLIKSINISFKSEQIQPTKEGNAGEGLAILQLLCDKKAAANLPVTFNYSGGFLVNNKFKSDSKGTIPTPALQLSNNTNETLKAQIDLKTLGRLATKNLIVRQHIEKQKPASAVISVVLAH
ncbi:LPP20 family lipoprotein [Carboxylicivirga sp. M1479]|uniref:LPP20 family lipoprotein n=1 Tax=Carboxylicivirga sp. M1479 TaxID=2594476 RepID=UPI001177D919|nr:LPP20 family lipoprotein [Carboxylicivirga sp. M1479]TRX60400.1 hypothetical protein FNN09_20710 [Carboxylicivirga sp. M1479]